MSAFGFTGATFDSRLVRPGMLYVALKGEKADGNDFIPEARAKGAAKVIGGPQALEELQSLAREYRRSLKAKVVGVTGSAGKTTTKELLSAFLSCVGKTFATPGNFNNHLGLPMTILNCPEDADFLVVEMGSNHPGEIAALCDIAEPDIGLVTGIGTAHLEFFRTRAGIAEEKGTLLARSKAFSVFPAADDFASVLSSRAATAIPVAGAVEGLLDPLQPRPPHFTANAALAFAVAARLGVTCAQAAGSLAGFKLPGARWRLCVKGGATFIDDTYNANPDSMIAALDALAAMPCTGKRIAVLGDMFELGTDSLALHREVFDHAQALNVPLVIGVGEQSAKCPCTCAYTDLAQVQAKLRSCVSAGDLVLLKASHSMGLGRLLD